MLAGVLAYWSALGSPFLFDDQPSVVDNGTIRSLTSPGDVFSPPRDTPVAGRPLVNLSFALNYAAAGLNPRGYRVVNLAIHLLAGLVLFATVRRALLLPRLRERFAAHATNLAFASALLWTLHPLQSEAVNYITERTESLMGLFYLLTVYASVRAATAPGAAWTVVAIATCIAGVLSKESMVTAPVAVLLIDRVYVYDSWRALFAARARLYTGFAVAWAVVFASLSTAQRSSVGFEAGTSAWVYLLNQARMVTQYLKVTFWPRDLVLDYGMPEALTPGDVLLPGLLVVALLLAAIGALVYRPRIGVLGAWFFITLAPTSSFVPISTEVGAERRMYLPLAGIIVLLVIGVDWIARRVGGANLPGLRSQSERLVRRLSTAMLVVVAGLMIIGITLRNRDYASPVTMAQTIVDRWPNGRGHYLLGTLLIEQQGRRAEGMAQLQLSARDYPGALFAIATEQIAGGQTAEGIDTIRRFIALMPNHVNVVPARDMLARAYAIQGNMNAAETEARQLVRAAPRYAPGHDLLGRLLAGRGDFAGAAAAFQQVLAIDPANADAQRNLATVQRLAAGNR